METDRFTGYRYYSADQLDAANKIRMLREVGFSLDSIKRFLNAGSLDGARQYYEDFKTCSKGKLKFEWSVFDHEEK
jgi:DNA-binding transcriptional MerR regulator